MYDSKYLLWFCILLKINDDRKFYYGKCDGITASYNDRSLCIPKVENKFDVVHLSLAITNRYGQ